MSVSEVGVRYDTDWCMNAVVEHSEILVRFISAMFFSSFCVSRHLLRLVFAAFFGVWVWPLYHIEEHYSLMFCTRYRVSHGCFCRICWRWE